VPFALTLTVPWVGALVMTMLAGSSAPSTSPSLLTKLMTTLPPSSTEALSAEATGASLTAVTPTLTVAVLMPPWPSEMATVKLSEPLKLLPGV
jgi:hypothetical protein